MDKVSDKTEQPINLQTVRKQLDALYFELDLLNKAEIERFANRPTYEGFTTNSDLIAMQAKIEATSKLFHKLQQKAEGNSPSSLTEWLYISANRETNTLSQFDNANSHRIYDLTLNKDSNNPNSLQLVRMITLMFLLSYARAKSYYDSDPNPNVNWSKLTNTLQSEVNKTQVSLSKKDRRWLETCKFSELSFNSILNELPENLIWLSTLKAKKPSLLPLKLVALKELTTLVGAGFLADLPEKAFKNYSRALLVAVEELIVSVSSEAVNKQDNNSEAITAQIIAASFNLLETMGDVGSQKATELSEYLQKQEMARQERERLQQIEAEQAAIKKATRNKRAKELREAKKLGIEPPPLPALISTAAVAEILGVSADKVRQWISEDKIEVVRTYRNSYGGQSYLLDKAYVESEATKRELADEIEAYQKRSKAHIN